MPPRGGRGQTDEAKKASFDNYYQSEEHALCEALFKIRKDPNHELKAMENGTDDIVDDWSPVLNKIFKLVEILKVPGRKAKQYEQSMFRTMVFRRVELDIMDIDGNSYEVTNACKHDHTDCKEKFLNIIMHIEQCYDDDYLTQDNLGSFKKDLISKLKDFEKKYVKHCKTTNPLLAAIQHKAMQPVVDLMESSTNLYNFRILAKKREIPDFRKKALVEKFIEHLSKVCKILEAFKNKEDKTLDQEYDIRHILELLDIEDWESCPPFKFYLDPLQKAYDALVAHLGVMNKLGPLRCSYYVERNLVMTQLIFELVRQYNIVKILMGDELKRDQFKFIYQVHETVYSSALKDIYLDEKSNQAVMQTVIPEQTVFQAMLLIRDIDDKKASDIEKKQKKKEERAALGLSEEEEEELKLDLPPQPVKKTKKKVEIDPEIIEAARVVALYKRELLNYGRTWIWENYYKEDQDRKDFWLAGAAALRRINIQVLDDIEDFILLKGFTSERQTVLQVEAIGMRIKNDLLQKRKRQAMEMAGAGQEIEEEKKNDPLEMGEEEDKKRKFITPLRPHKKIWNFIQSEEDEDRIAHVLRADADPTRSYIDGRIQDLLVVMEGMGAHLRMHQDAEWVHLNTMTMAIFAAREEELVKRMDVYEKMLEEQAAK